MKKNWKPVGLVFLITGLDLIFGPFLLYFMKNSGVSICSPAHASDYPLRLLLQCLVLSAYSITLFLVFLIRLKGDFPKAFSLSVQGKIQWLWVGGLLCLLAVMVLVSIQRTGDPVLIFLNLIYYVVFIGFAEEFLIRGVCVYLLREMPWRVKYLLPNFLFALLHIFAFNHFAPLTPASVLGFLTSDVLGLMASGCCFQLLKDRTGTLWVPVLLHGMLDFSTVFLR